MRRHVRVNRFGRMLSVASMLVHDPIAGAGQVMNTPDPAAGFKTPPFGRKALLRGVDLSIFDHSRTHGAGGGWQCPVLIAVEFAKHRLEGCR